VVKPYSSNVFYGIPFFFMCREKGKRFTPGEKGVDPRLDG
jgi:hypothetical protein